jgi:hypothetical protein
MDVLARVHPHDILDVALGALIVLERRLPARPEVARAFGRALLAAGALRELVETEMTDRRASQRTRRTRTLRRGGRATGELVLA